MNPFLSRRKHVNEELNFIKVAALSPEATDQPLFLTPSHDFGHRAYEVFGLQHGPPSVINQFVDISYRRIRIPDDTAENVRNLRIEILQGCFKTYREP